MADNVETGTGVPVATDEVTYSGDTGKHVQLVRFVQVTGAEGSKTVVGLIGADEVTDAHSGEGILVTGIMGWNGVSWDRIPVDGDNQSLIVSGLVVAQGEIASGTADQGNPLKIGGKASDLVSGLPTPVTPGDRVDAMFGPFGEQAVSLFHPQAGALVDGNNPLPVVQVSPSEAATYGPDDHDAPIAHAPVVTAGAASAAAPSAVSTDGDVVRSWHLLNGAQATVITAAGALVGGDAANGLDVDVTRLPALPAGNNNIGDVDIASVPAPLSTTGAGTEATALRVTVATDSTGVLSVDDNAASLTVDNPTISVVGSGTEATAQRVTIATDSTGVLSVDDNGAALSVDWNGTTPVTGSGTATGALRVELANNGTGLVGLNAGSNNIGDVDIASLPTRTKVVTTTVTRPNDTTAYAAGDEISSSTSAPGDITFTSCAIANGGSGIIQAVAVRDSAYSATPADLELWIFDTAPGTDNDNGAFAPTDGQMDTALAVIPLGTGFPGDPTAGTNGNRLYYVGGLALPFVCTGSSTSLYARLMTRNAYTPIAVEVWSFRLVLLQDA